MPTIIEWFQITLPFESRQKALDTHVRVCYPLPVCLKDPNVGQCVCNWTDIMEHDRLGRRRSPEQGRGLRPLHPRLPEEWVSKALRVAMSESDWSLFERLVARYTPNSPTLARSHGLLLADLLHRTPQPEPELGPLDWMDWERRKTLRLLLPSGS